jgi:lactoylglutathione lyase
MTNTFLHTCYLISDIESSVAFYEKLGFTEVQQIPVNDEETNVFMADGPGNPVLELTWKKGLLSSELGTGYDHIALSVTDLDGTLASLAEDGIEPESPPFHWKDRPTGSYLAFVRDPDGYRIEILELGDEH